MTEMSRNDRDVAVRLTRLLRVLRNVGDRGPLSEWDEEHLSPLLDTLSDLVWGSLFAAAEASPTGMAGGEGPDEDIEVPPLPTPWEEIVPKALELLQGIENVDYYSEEGKLLRACLGAVNTPVLERHFGEGVEAACTCAVARHRFAGEPGK